MPFGRLFGRRIGRRTRPRIEDEQRRRAGRLAQAALRLYGLHDAEEIHLLRHDFVQVFYVRSALGDEEFSLRLYGMPEGVRERHPRPPATEDHPEILTATALRSPQVLRSQLGWLSALREDIGLLGPEPVPTTDGEPVGRVTVEGTPWQRRSTLARWVPGVHKGGAVLSEADLIRVGSLLATMHNHAEG